MKSATLPAVEAEEELVRKASNHDLEAFNQLVIHYQDIVYQSAFAMLGDSAAAQDVTQDSFIKAFREICHFRGGHFRSWLLRIVRNTTYDHLRQLKRRAVVPLFPEDEYGDEIENIGWLVDSSAMVETTAEYNEDSRRLYQLLDELPAKFRSILTLVDIYEMDYEEVAQVLNIPLGTVKSRLARARLQMRRKLLNYHQVFNHYHLPVSVNRS